MTVFANALSAALGRCIATKAVWENGKQVGFMYREAPVFEHDSGWRFFSGDETDEYCDNPDNFVVCSIADITNISPDIAALTAHAEGTAWEQNEYGEFIAVNDWQPKE